ncbi:MAG: class I SAM-dependent methyltransferase [Eggerthellaceae bacterium]|nr:class I SAM-dependent methyltransferase [Eggerthellaceae bacterium]
MKDETIKILNSMNAQFYERNAASFSATRAHGWLGWQVVATHIDAYITKKNSGAEQFEFCLGDVAAGNLRFYDFLNKVWPHIVSCITYKAFDSSASLEHLACIDDVHKKDVSWTQCDIVKHLQDKVPLAEVLGESVYDVIVSFGFMHHIPSYEMRLRFLQDLVSAVKPGGLVIVSLWQFMNNQRLAHKAQVSTACAFDFFQDAKRCPHEEALDISDLEQDDYILGWQNGGIEFGSMRYCHHFSHEEIGSYIQDLHQVELVDRFLADGKSGELNTYLIFRKK